MAELIFPDIGASFREGQAFGAQQRHMREGEERRSALSRLASQAYGAPQEERTSLLSQMAALNPQAAQEQEQQFASGDDRRNKELLSMARLLVAAPDTDKPMLYARMRPSLNQLGLQTPDAYGPDVADTAAKLVQAWGGGDNKRNLAVSPGSAIVDPETGRVIYERDFAPVKPQFQEDVNGQGWWLEPGKAPVPVNAPSGAPVAARGPESGQAYTIDPSLPPAVQAAIRSNEQAWSQAQDGSGVQLPPQAAPAAQSGPMFAPAGGIRDTFTPLTSDEVVQAGLPMGTVAQRNQRTGQINVVSKPDAPAGFRFKQDGTLEPIPGGPKPAGAAATEDERKAAGWLSQAANAYANMEKALQDDSSANEPGFLETYIPIDEIANRTRSDERQRYVQASSSFGEAVLRAATGAGVNRDEALQKVRELTPQRGDSQGVRDQKRAAMTVYLDSLRTRAGRAAPAAAPATQPASVARPQTEADFAALPSGATYIDPDDGRTYRKP